MRPTHSHQSAGDWNGNLLAIQAIAAVLWAVVLAGFRRRKLGYSLSLLIGAAGFVSVFFIHNCERSTVGCRREAMKHSAAT